ncbi:hypothetical protein MLD38_007619 [Melastoma candidum]|uniref:Uncharacterized protein n=1 Tax=Melastoma candidum TaxID=119954 RepID=A0ACB9RSX5_9MYRT|nr:hypothetical protein MLD38_007619 [Melastoma candidum]
MLILLLCPFFIFLLSLSPFLFARSLKMEEEEEEEEKEAKIIPHKEEEPRPSLLDLPELTLDCILDKLSPAGLCSMSAVCRPMRERCKSDRLWGKHMDQKWGRVVGGMARVEWDRRVVEPRRIPGCLPKGNGTSSPVSRFWMFSWVRQEPAEGTKRGRDNSLPSDSVMALYLSLENGNFWFPAQVYNREVMIGIMTPRQSMNSES